ncbi:MAG: AMP-binding protein [Micromonosporaceae bacterium]
MSARPINLADLIEVMADRIGDRPAFMTEDREYSYAEVDERATRLANHLVGAGIRPGDHVAVHATNRIEWVDAFYGALKARAVPINVNYRYLHNELQHVYANSESVMAIVAPEFVGAVKAIQDKVPTLKRLLILGGEYDAALAAASQERRIQGRSSDDHYIIYTGGTTGLPKGVIWRQEDVMRGAMNGLRLNAPFDGIEQLAAEAAAAAGQVRLFSVGPLMHGGSQWMLGSTAVAGGVYVLYTQAGFDAEQVLDLVSRAKVNMMNILGDAVARPLADAILAYPGRWDLSNLLAVANGAAPLSAAVRRDLRKALPNCIHTDSYGSSESGMTGHRSDDPVLRSVPRFDLTPDVMIVDDQMRPCQVGQVGLVARSGRVPLGYLNDPERTAATFKEINGKRWVITGDTARVEDDGSYSLLGRGVMTINSGGEKIHPEEVEGVLMEHPAVAEAGVVGTPHPRWGQQVTAVVKLREGASVSPGELQQHCRTLIADYKVPKTVLLVDHLPRTPATKIEYPALYKMALELVGQSQSA